MILKTTFCACILALLFAGTTVADVTVEFSDIAAPTYSNTLNFDEQGGPTGIVDPGSWSSLGITEFQAGDGVPQVDNWDGIFGGGGGWLGTDNSFFGNFGVFITFDSDLTEFSSQVWDPSGPPDFSGGGLGVFLFDDGNIIYDAFVEGLVEPAWGGIGNDWLDITTSGGTVFDEVRILGFGFTPTTFVDNLSWNKGSAIPEPGSTLLMALAGMALLVRRRK